MWTKESLQQLIKERLSDYLFIVVSNRQPYIHSFRKGEIVFQRGAGGVITALDPVMRACSGLWVAHGNGDADPLVTDRKGRVMVPPNSPSYTLKRVFLSKEEVDSYYYGYSNQAIWPLCHMAFQRPEFYRQHWKLYVEVNKKFAHAVLEEIKDRKAFVFIQDYHLALLPKFLKESGKDQLIVAHFWHIPWPNHETFRICPQKREILDGLLYNDLLGFHIRYFCDNFLEAVDREMESRIDRERYAVIRGENETLVRAFPISVDFEELNRISQTPNVEQAQRELMVEYGLSKYKIVIGLDRIDYTKGIPERLLAIDRLLEKYPRFKEKIIFIQMGEISRIHLSRYKMLNDQINALVEEINWKHSTGKWKPIIMVRRHLDFAELIAFYKLASVCVVSSLHDGMNLVAKEFVSSRSDEDGVLILSQFTGASRELDSALLINPYDREDFADQLAKALTLSKKERQKRMRKLREVVSRNNIYRWAGKIISELLKLEFKEEE
ncbi:MAG TPA: trehalose-6-phosphate synthase [Candidatus Omnitrophica bacterium]|nr:trehalose-6-phosphate synthase [Candidatus Omnitrophota bacterium]